jgi:hypothetical protein
MFVAAAAPPAQYSIDDDIGEAEPVEHAARPARHATEQVPRTSGNRCRWCAIMLCLFMATPELRRTGGRGQVANSCAPSPCAVAI